MKSRFIMLVIENKVVKHLEGSWNRNYTGFLILAAFFYFKNSVILMFIEYNDSGGYVML